MKIPSGPSFGNEKFGKLPGNFAQAFDLSTLAKPHTSQKNHVEEDQGFGAREVLDSNIVSDFIKYSATVPVFLMVYSERAVGSLELLQTLSRLAVADGGKWRLGGINFDTQPELVQALGATTIPFAIAFINEKALPLPELPNDENQLRVVINKILEIASEQGMATSDNKESDVELSEPEEDEAFQAIERQDYESAIAAYKKLLTRVPNHEFAQLGKAQCELALRIKGKDPEKALAESDADPKNVEALLLAADTQISAGSVEEAFDRLIAFIKSSKGEDQKAARDHILALFTLFSSDDPIIFLARKRLASALF